MQNNSFSSQNQKNLKDYSSMKDQLQPQNSRMSANRYFDSAKNELDTKQIQISQLKAELYDLQTKDKDLSQLSKKLSNIQQKYSLLQEEKKRAERDRRMQYDQDQKSVISTREEIEILKNDLRNLNIDLQQFKGDNKALRELAEFKESEINKFKKELQNLDNSDQRQSQINMDLAQQIRQFKDDKRQLIAEADQLTLVADEALQKNRLLEKSIKQLQQENHKYDKQLVQLQKQNNQFNLQLQSKGNEKDQIVYQKKENIKMINNLQQEVEELQKLGDSLQEQVISSRQSVKEELDGGQILLQKNNNIETSIRSKELHIEDLRNNFENQKLKHYHLLDDQKDLKIEQDRAIAITEDLSKINNELSNQLEDFRIQDQSVINMLNRGDKYDEVQQKVQQKQQTTFEPIAHLINYQHQTQEN